MAPIVGRFGSLRGGRDGAIAQLGERVVRNDEVGGSIPPGSTSRRLLRKLRVRHAGGALCCRAAAGPLRPPPRPPSLFACSERPARKTRPVPYRREASEGCRGV